MIDKVIVESYDLRDPLPKKGSFHYADEAVIENMTPEPASRSGTLSWLQSSAVSMSLTTRVLSGELAHRDCMIRMCLALEHFYFHNSMICK
jgi:hypothetical protein